MAANWRDLGGRYSGTPAIISWAPGRLDIFVRGTDNAVYHKWQDGPSKKWNPSEQGWEFLGGTIFGNVAAVSRGPNLIDLFAQGTDNAVYQKWWDGESWSDWHSLGGQIIGDISAVSSGLYRLDLVVRGVDNAVYHKVWQQGSWEPSTGGWNSLGGAILGSPKAIAWGPERVDIFARGAKNGVIQKTWNGESWGSIQDSGEPDHLDNFVDRTGNSLLHSNWTDTNWSNDWRELHGVTVDDVAVVAVGAGRLDLFIQGVDNAIYQKTWDGIRWLPSEIEWSRLGGTAVSKPCAVATGPHIDVYYQGIDNAVWKTSYTRERWSNPLSLGGVFTDGPVVEPLATNGRPRVFARGTVASLFTSN